MDSLDDQVPAEGCGIDDSIYDTCRDTNFDADGNLLADSYGDPCSLYVGNEGWCGGYETDVFNSIQMCCACGGGEDASEDSEGEDGDGDGNGDGNGDGDGDGDGTVPSALELVMQAEDAATIAIALLDESQGILDSLSSNKGLDDQVATALAQTDLAIQTNSNIFFIVDEAQTEENIDTLGQLKQEVIAMQRIVNQAAGKVKRAKNAGVRNKQALVEAAEAIMDP